MGSERAVRWPFEWHGAWAASVRPDPRVRVALYSVRHAKRVAVRHGAVERHARGERGGPCDVAGCAAHLAWMLIPHVWSNAPSQTGFHPHLGRPLDEIRGGTPHGSANSGGGGGMLPQESVVVDDVGFTAQSQRAMKQAGRMCMGVSIPGTGHTAYVFDILTTNGERWKVTRRYSDFLDLNKKLIQVCRGLPGEVQALTSTLSYPFIPQYVPRAPRASCSLATCACCPVTGFSHAAETSTRLTLLAPFLMPCVYRSRPSLCRAVM
jgi:hypothetical protein